MRSFEKALLLLVTPFLFACSEGSKPTAGATDLESDMPAIAEEPVSRNSATGAQSLAALATLSDTVICEEKEERNTVSEADPILIKTCTYGDYKTISTASPDRYGRYSYEQSLYKRDNGAYRLINNTSLFNQKQEELLVLINQEIKENYHALSRDTESKDCFEGAGPLSDFEMDEFRIDFATDAVVFHAEFDLPNACRSVGGTAVSFHLKEVAPYIQKQ